MHSEPDLLGDVTNDDIRLLNALGKCCNQVFDTCVIGGGLAGLNTSISLASRGHTVCLIERDVCGNGASGHSGGFVDCGYLPIGFQRLERISGRRRARKIVQMSVRGWRLVKDRLNKAKIPTRSGMLTVSLKGQTGLEERAKLLRSKYGLDVEYIDRAELAKYVVSPCFYEGMIDNSGFLVAPQEMVVGLMQLARDAGVQILEHTEVRGFSRQRDGLWAVSTQANTMHTRNVVITTGDYSGSLEQRTDHTAFSLFSHVAETEPLSEEQIQSILPGKLAVSDTRNECDYFGLLPDGRLRWGGHASTHEMSDSDVRAMLTADIARTFPQLEVVELRDVGSYAFHSSATLMPHVGQIDKNMWQAVCFGPIGNSTTAMAGDVLADAITGNSKKLKLFAKYDRQRSFPGLRGVRSEIVCTGLKLADMTQGLKGKLSVSRQREPLP